MAGGEKAGPGVRQAVSKVHPTIIWPQEAPPAALSPLDKARFRLIHRYVILAPAALLAARQAVCVGCKYVQLDSGGNFARCGRCGCGQTVKTDMGRMPRMTMRGEHPISFGCPEGYWPKLCLSGDVPP